MTRTYARWALTAEEERLLDAQYPGRATPLRPIVRKLTEAALALGAEVSAEVTPSGVHFTRRRRFAVVKPSSATRLYLGLMLHDVAQTDRLLDAGELAAEGADLRVPIEELDDVDDQVLRWLALAYEQDGE